jgi:hypothetical protein
MRRLQHARQHQTRRQDALAHDEVAIERARRGGHGNVSGDAAGVFGDAADAVRRRLPSKSSSMSWASTGTSASRPGRNAGDAVDGGRSTNGKSIPQLTVGGAAVRRSAASVENAPAAPPTRRTVAISSARPRFSGAKWQSFMTSPGVPPARQKVKNRRDLPRITRMRVDYADLAC